MDDADPAAGNIESRIVEGWSALELGDLETARAALRDAYDVNPTHPALPLLAAGIRRVRPKPVPWRGVVLAAAVIVSSFIVGYRWMRSNPMPPGQSAVATTSIPDEPPRPSGPTGTAGQVEVPTPPDSRPQTGPKPLDDAALIRQSITRFEGAYRSRWAPLTFSGCEIAHEAVTATATCRDPRVDGVDGNAGRTWTFSLRKSGAAWRITSVQPSAPPP